MINGVNGGVKFAESLMCAGWEAKSPKRQKAAGKCPSVVRLRRRIQIRILAHLRWHLFAFFFVIHERFAVAEMAAFDAALRFAEQMARRSSNGPGDCLAALGQLSRLFGPRPVQQDVVVERQVLAVRAGIALAAAAAD